MTATVDLSGVIKRYGGIEAVRDVSFDLPAGETVALVGHNGAGKTTLLKLMLGLIRPTAGSVRVLGDNPAQGEFGGRRRLGYLPENVAFNPALTGREILSFYARLKGEPAAKALPLLDRVGLAEAASRRVGTYSKGMRQRLGLAQALIGEPLLLLLDEPTTGLDPALRLSFYEIIQQLRDRGATVVLSSHALTELEERAGRVIIMNRGIMVANGTIEELRRVAELPTRIRLTVAEGGARAAHAWMGQGESGRDLGTRVVEFEAYQGRKLALLRRATEQGAPVQDVDIVPPSLDELYAHFLRRQEAAE
ncbi:ABC transporter ATP-binding protein [Reyranella sp.]|uniref:ABC transporter ATP-binding protein n=1 Tax=Reyranella sp. TaxID=1929291 RepID=UPI00378407A5